MDSSSSERRLQYKLLQYNGVNNRTVITVKFLSLPFQENLPSIKT